jgi:TolB protein
VDHRTEVEACRGRNDLFLLASDGTRLRRLTTSPRFTSDEAPSWSPDGRQLVFTRERLRPGSSEPPFQELYLINSDGTGLRRLTKGSQHYAPVWSPDRRWIMFCDFPGGANQPPRTFLVPASGGSPRTLPLDPPGCVDDWQARPRR